MLQWTCQFLSSVQPRNGLKGFFFFFVSDVVRDYSGRRVLLSIMYIIGYIGGVGSTKILGDFVTLMSGKMFSDFLPTSFPVLHEASHS